MSSRAAFSELCEGQWLVKRLLSVGLDSDRLSVDQLVREDRSVRGGLGAQAIFNRAIVDATSDVVGAYKPNSAFYEASGADGISDLRETVRYINAVAPEIPVILDAKRGDIGNTNVAYAEYAFDYLGADAITLHPYLGQEALAPFLERRDRGVFVLCRTSNPGAAEFQDLRFEGRPLYETVAANVALKWNTHGNCGVVVGATYVEELRRVRGIVGNMPILIPGIGVQGGDLDSSVRAGLDSFGGGIFVNAARSVLFGSTGPEFADAARKEALKLHVAIQAAAQ